VRTSKIWFIVNKTLLRHHRAFFLVTFILLFSERAYCLPQNLLQKSFVTPIIYDNYYYASASVQISIKSTLGKNISLKEAELKATKLIFDQFCLPIWEVPEKYLPYEKLILSECNRKNKYLVEGLVTFEKKITKDEVVVTVSVPESSLPKIQDRKNEAIPYLANLAILDEIFDIFLIYELDLIKNKLEVNSVSYLQRKLSSIFGENSMDVLFNESQIDKVPLFYSSHDSQKWITKFQNFGKNEFLSAFEYGPYFNDLCYYAGKYFKNHGYAKMSELFFLRGSKFKFQPQYYDLCRAELGLEPILKDTNNNVCRTIIEFIICSHGELPIRNDIQINESYRNGIKSFNHKDFSQAYDFFTKAAGENFNSDTLNYLGRTLEEIGDKEQAIACFKQAVKINPNHPYAGTNLAFSLFFNGQEKEAIDMKNELLKNLNLNDWCKERLESIVSQTSINENFDPLDFLE
jgi:tetratricopeptide (TPR) repeat protein